MGRPRTGETPLHSVRVPLERWNAALELAAAQGTSISVWINNDLQARLDAAADTDAERPTQGSGRAPDAAGGSAG